MGLTVSFLLVSIRGIATALSLGTQFRMFLCMYVYVFWEASMVQISILAFLLQCLLYLPLLCTQIPCPIYPGLLHYFPLTFHPTFLFLFYLKISLQWLPTNSLSSMGISNGSHISGDLKLTCSNRGKHVAFVFLCLTSLRMLVSISVHLPVKAEIIGLLTEKKSRISSELRKQIDA